MEKNHCYYSRSSKKVSKLQTEIIILLTACVLLLFKSISSSPDVVELSTSTKRRLIVKILDKFQCTKVVLNILDETF